MDLGVGWGDSGTNFWEWGGETVAAIFGSGVGRQWQSFLANFRTYIKKVMKNGKKGVKLTT